MFVFLMAWKLNHHVWCWTICSLLFNFLIYKYTQVSARNGLFNLPWGKLHLISVWGGRDRGIVSFTGGFKMWRVHMQYILLICPFQKKATLWSRCASSWNNCYYSPRADVDGFLCFITEASFLTHISLRHVTACWLHSLVSRAASPVLFLYTTNTFLICPVPSLACSIPTIKVTAQAAYPFPVWI